jgi:hypothetical protein
VTANEFYRENGYFIPFTHPVDFPDTELDDEPQVRLCFNADWVPYVLGALKILARPETWEASKEGRDVLVQEAMSFAGRIQENCTDPPPVPFYAPYVSANPYGSHNGDLFAEYWPIDNPSEPDPEFRYFLVAGGDGLVGLDITVKFARTPENCDISPYLSRLRIEAQNGLGYAFVLDILNSFDQHEIVTDFLPFEKADFECKQFNLVLGSAEAIATIAIDTTGDLFADCA